MRLIDNKNLRGQDKRKLINSTRNKGYASVESERIRNEYLQKRGKIAKGPRGMFLEALEQEGVTVEQAIESTIEQMKVLLKRDLIKWMREELVKGRLSNKTMEKIRSKLW